MPIVSVPKTVSDTPTLPSGQYGDEEPVKIVSCNVRDVPGANEDQEIYLDIGCSVPHTSGMVFVHTDPFRQHTRFTENSGSKLYSFLKQLGVPNPEEEFDTDNLIGKDVVVSVHTREYTDKDGQARTRSSVTNIVEKL
jgi:hypothetical protein